MPTDDMTRWFQVYCAELESGVTQAAIPGVSYCCPCCGYPTLGERGGFEICVLCNWEDDGQDDHNAACVLGGPNGGYSLAEARTNFDTHTTSYRPTDRYHFERTTRNGDAKGVACEHLAGARWKRAVRLTAEAEALLGELHSA